MLAMAPLSRRMAADIWRRSTTKWTETEAVGTGGAGLAGTRPCSRKSDPLTGFADLLCAPELPEHFEMISHPKILFCPLADKAFWLPMHKRSRR